MGCTKSIVYKYICQRSQVFGKCLFVLCLLCTVTSIFKKNYFSVFHSFYRCLCVVTNYIGIRCKFDFLSQKFGKTFCYWCKRQLWLWLSFWLSEMGAKNYFAAVFDQLLDRRKRCLDTCFIRDISVFQRYVKIASYQDAFPFYVNVVYRFFV